VHVRGDQRSRGVGALLLDAAEQLAREHGCYRIQLTSRNVREDAHRFYRGQGYEQSSQGFKKVLEVEHLS
jgi:GNAT superfamily N-acetyltransferase